MKMLVRLGITLRNTAITLYAQGGDDLYTLPHTIVDFGGGVIEADLDGLPQQNYRLEVHALRDGVMHKLPRAGFAHIRLPQEHTAIDVSEPERRYLPLHIKVGCNYRVHLWVGPAAVRPRVTLDGVEQTLDTSDLAAGIVSFRLSGKHDAGRYEILITDGETRYPKMVLTIISDIMGNGRFNNAPTTLTAYSVGWATETTSSVAAQTVIEPAPTAFVSDAPEHDWLTLLQQDGAGYVNERLAVLTGQPTNWYWLGEPHDSLIVSDALLQDATAFQTYATKAAILGCKCNFKEPNVQPGSR